MEPGEKITCPICQEPMTKDEFVKSHMSKHAEHLLLLEPVLAKDYDEGKAEPKNECTKCHKKEPCRFLLSPLQPHEEPELLCHSCAYKQIETTDEATQKLNYLVVPRTADPGNAFSEIITLAEKHPTILQDIVIKNICEINDCDNTRYTCDICGKQTTTGLRFKCDVCDNYDMCSRCYYRYRILSRTNDMHDQSHTFTVIKKDMNPYTKLVGGEDISVLKSCGIKF